MYEDLSLPLPPGEGDVNTSPRRKAWRDGLDEPTRRWLARDEAAFLRQSLSTPCLDVLDAASGSILTDLSGRELLDFHGNSVHQIGHGHPEVIGAVKRTLDALPFCPRRYANAPAVLLAERLNALFPGGQGKTLFSPGGTTAVGMALKLARAATGRFKTLSMWDSFHGASLDAISVGGEGLFRTGIGPLLPGTEHAPAPEPFRCAIGPDIDRCRDAAERCAACGLACARYLAYVLEQEGDIGCVIAEPMRCTSVSLPPPGYWQAVREACDRHGALLVFDETATCLGRTGRMFACEHFGVAPDILVLGKGLGGGVMQLAAIVARADLDVAPHMALGHYTHEKSPASCAAGLAVLDVIERDGLLARSRELGQAALVRLKAMAGAHPFVADVRGLGLSLAVELADPETGAQADDLADAVMYDCLARGLSFKVSHGNVLTLTPPLTITEADLFRALDILSDALDARR